MGKKNSEVMIEGDMFSETMREAQRAYNSKEWEKFKKIFADNDKMYLLQDFDLCGNTAITKAVDSNDPEILKELLGKLSEEERWRVIRKKNHAGNTLLHEIAEACNVAEMADIVLDFEKTIPLPPELAEKEKAEMAELSSEEKKEQEEEKRRPLLEWKNLKGETPVFKAAKFGNLKMLTNFVKHAENLPQANMKIHQESATETILHASVNGQYFDVALWIIMNMDKSSLAVKKNKNGLTSLQLLARMPTVFYSHYEPQRFMTKIVYKLLPDEGYDIEGCNSFDRLLRTPARDLETGEHQDDPRPPTTPGCLSKINYAFWNSLPGVFQWIIEPIRKEKKKHQLAERLVKFLVKCDYSWQYSYDESNDKPPTKLPPVLYNVAKRRQELKWKRKQKVLREGNEEDEQETAERQQHPPLRVAAANGITEIIKFYFEEHPKSINHVSEDGQNILHVVVTHRQEKILDLLEDEQVVPFLASRVNGENRTALHQVAGMDYYRAPALPGAALQLQEELNWHKRVEEIVPSHLHFHCDKDLLTAGDLLDIEHDQMLADAQRWIKETAQSCSTVAVLVATVVFAAAYAIPGGTEGGSALLSRAPVFIFFTVMDIVAVAFSLASVVTFLSILNAPFELWDFHKSLPKRLRRGFAFLFLALSCTMLAFSATILITIRLPPKQWTSTLVYSAALFPVTIFALFEFPLYEQIWSTLSKGWKRMIPIGRSSRRVL
ncbi:uncharacterized protein LOC114714661 [Neltuma alba]|uniref:uncharacterized protein LOC114714661 n=1 Tax=Neltuma alba TaxID=207710 RepID=UPI0010A3BF63|nr:uncharacterized protein LOC114714661 [Prosopis alba]